MADDANVAGEESKHEDIEYWFGIAKRRAKHIHENLTNLSPVFKWSWFDAIAALFCVFFGWQWKLYIIGALAFCLYWVLRRILHSVLGTHLLLVCIHQQLIYLAQRRHVPDPDVTCNMQYVLEEYARHGEFRNLGWRYAFADMLQTSLREEGLNPHYVSDEFYRYLNTTDPNYTGSKSGLSPVSPPYSNKDLDL